MVARNDKHEPTRSSRPDGYVDATVDALVVPGVATIPLSEIEITYARSSGPGGQNVNKVSSKARLRWNLNSGRLSPETVERFKTLYPSWVTLQGEVVITAQQSRDAPKNRASCLRKLRDAIARAAIVPKERIPTRPTRGSVRRRLEDKRRQAEKKQSRSFKNYE